MESLLELPTNGVDEEEAEIGLKKKIGKMDKIKMKKILPNLF